MLAQLKNFGFDFAVKIDLRLLGGVIYVDEI
jgi:hypothetical protein